LPADGALCSGHHADAGEHIHRISHRLRPRLSLLDQLPQIRFSGPWRGFRDHSTNPDSRQRRMNDEWYDRALGRIKQFIVLVGVTGALGILIARGRMPAAGFLLGAGFSLLNFQLLCTFTRGAGGRSKPVALVLASLRYLLIGGAAYVIVRVLEI